MSIKDNNHIAKSFFTPEEVLELKKIIYSYYNSRPKAPVDLDKIKTDGYPKDTVMIQDWSGRSSFRITDMLPSNIIKKLEDYVEGYGAELDWYSFTFVRYSNEFGTPNLGPHLDEHDTNFTIDYQLESNTSWSVVVEGKEYDLSDNDAAVFSPSEQVHWRNPKRFADGEYVDMILFYFTVKSNSKKLTVEEKIKISSQYQSSYFKKVEEL
jgi:hypothetical protein